MGMRARLSSVLSLAVAFFALTSGVLLHGATKSYVVKQYDIATLKTYDFKAQRRSATDPITTHPTWSDDIRHELTSALNRAGFQQVSGSREPDVLLAYYVGLTDRQDQFQDYSYPGFWGPRRFDGGWGWPAGSDVWNVPYTDSTIIVDIIDAQTDQMIWRGYDTNTINMRRPEKQLDKAVNALVKKFLKDTQNPN